MAECRTILYSGRVQGVGFRFTVRQIAFRHEVTGTVRNLPDGRVELVAEGEPEELDYFTSSVATELRSFIRDIQTEISTASGRFTGFAITY